MNLKYRKDIKIVKNVLLSTFGPGSRKLRQKSLFLQNENTNALKC